MIPDFIRIADGNSIVDWLACGHVGITISGDVMAPNFLHGQTIVFQVLATGSLPPIGEDCLIVRRAGEGNQIIFRRVADVDTNGVVTLAALNAAKYPEPLITMTAEIVLVAVARWLAQPFDDRSADT